MSVEELFSELNIDYRVLDTRNTGLPDDSVDFIISNSTLEPIPAGILSSIFLEFRRIIRSDGFMSHHIDMKDHYATFDRNISDYNYLRYSDGLWNIIGNNRLHYQNRLRASDYQKLHQSTGFQICGVTEQKGVVDQLCSIGLAKRFQSYSEDDLSVLTTWIVSRPASDSKARNSYPAMVASRTGH